MIENLIKTLNSIEVHGKDNLAKLLGVIYALEDMAVRTEPREEQTDGE